MVCRRDGHSLTYIAFVFFVREHSLENVRRGGGLQVFIARLVLMFCHARRLVQDSYCKMSMVPEANGLRRDCSVWCWWTASLRSCSRK